MLVKGGVLATTALALTQKAVADPLVAAPSEEGQAILKLIAAQRAVMGWAAAYDERGDEASSQT